MMHSLFFVTGLNLLLGALLGAVGGLFGIGGGLIAIHVLAFLYGMDQQLVQGTALVMIVPNVLIGFWRYKQRNKIAMRLALMMSIPSVLVTWVAAHFAIAVSARSLQFAFAVFMAVLALYYLWALLNKDKNENSPGWLLPTKYLPGVGIFSGATAGFFSVGGAIVAVPMMVALFGITQTAAQGLGLAMVAPGTLVALWTYAKAGHVDWNIGIPLAIGGVFSVSWGVALAHHISERRLRMLFCVALFAISIAMFLHGQ